MKKIICLLVKAGAITLGSLAKPKRERTHLNITMVSERTHRKTDLEPKSSTPKTKNTFTLGSLSLDRRMATGFGSIERRMGPNLPRRWWSHLSKTSPKPLRARRSNRDPDTSANGRKMARMVKVKNGMLTRTITLGNLLQMRGTGKGF